MKLNEESSDFVYLGKRIDKALDYIQNNKTDLLGWFKQYVEVPYQDTISGELDLEEEDYTFDYLDSLLDDFEKKFNLILEKQNKMKNEFNRMQKLAGVPVTKTKKQLDENFVGMSAINSPFMAREKAGYETAFEHYMGKLHEEEGADGGENPIDAIMMDVPLFIRMLEYAREDASNDMDLHNLAEKAIAMSAEGEVLSMDNYEDLVGGEAEAETEEEV